MERLDGFAWDDVEGMRSAGIDTAAVLRAEMVSFLEGAMLYGVFHGDLHGGNLFVQSDGRVALLDFGITGRLDEQQRLAFLPPARRRDDQRHPHPGARRLKELGALPADADIEQVIKDLGLDKPALDVITMSADELTAQLRDLTKQLLGVRGEDAEGADVVREGSSCSSTARSRRFAPEIDLLGEVALIATYFADRYGERIASEIGVDPRDGAGRPRRAASLDGPLDGHRAPHVPGAPGTSGGPAPEVRAERTLNLNMSSRVEVST